MIRIIIADDHSIVREGLKQIIADTPDMIIADEAENGHELISKIETGKYNVAVVDISMPDSHILDLLKHIRQIQPRLPVLILSMHPEDQYGVRVMKAGAAGYLTKESAPTDLITALRTVSAGKKYISATLAEKLIFALNNHNSKAPHETLSDREFQVFCMLAESKPAKEIAAELYLSEKTISTYRSRILSKMQLKNNSELIHYAVKNGLANA
ncbi:MAG: DNA-binding response regulator [Desulfobacteraceae bacterium]|jgi:DNA-binding NarL/FixJ family response regulator|nr:MAG: DNA-binding response regulator [Desulfobacteraceae bacterium]